MSTHNFVPNLDPSIMQQFAPICANFRPAKSQAERRLPPQGGRRFHDPAHVIVDCVTSSSTADTAGIF
jgi:hypothetical protein